MDIQRPFWLKQIQGLWKKRPIVWLAGVRRTGKTTLAESISDSTFINCDLPSEQRRLQDPEEFFKSLKTKVVIFDEIHQLDEASQILKIAADQFKRVRVLATGSSTMVAGRKFKDSLTDRKRNLHFLPVLVSELDVFGRTLQHRIFHGGLPPSLLIDQIDTDFFAEWLDSFYSRDVQELFQVERRQPFLKVLEYVLVLNGQQVDVTKLAKACGISRPTAIRYLEILEVTQAISIVRPHSTNPLQEIIRQPKIYGFDTGFSCYARGIKDLRNEDKGLYLENLTLETMQALGLGKKIHYWRNKNQNEIDFVLTISASEVMAIECKWKEDNFDIGNLEIFRKSNPKGANWVITADSKTRTIKRKNLQLQFINIFDLQTFLESKLEKTLR